MPSPGFIAARALLSASEQSALDSQLADWKAEPAPSERPQIAANIEIETALAPTVFAQLLSNFLAELPAHSDAVVAWGKACEIHAFAGNLIAAPDRPSHLGRACKFDAYVGRCGLPDDKLKTTFAKYSGKAPASAFERLLRKQKLGGAVIFATFGDTDPMSEPFHGLPRDREAIRTALGLGKHTSMDPYLLFTYVTHQPPALPLYRPTVADAGDFSYFRPGKDVADKWGMTHPLTPNPRNLPARPELVHEQITGARLVFPYEITSS